jgi:hypothetical protein
MLYFVPNAKSLSASLRTEHGLDRLLASSQCRETFQGPDGPGLLIAEATAGADYLHYTADKQTWSKRFGYTSLVGTWDDQPITPAQLARPKLIEGEQIELLDGHRWQVPRLRQWRDEDQLRWEHALPRVMQQSQTTGRFVLGSVIPKYRQLWETSLRIADSMFGQLQAADSAELEDSVVEQFACDLLAANYRVDASVISHLQLLTPELCGAVIRAGLDWETLRAAIKNRLSR